MAICPVCGEYFPDSESYCPECGCVFEDDEEE